MSLRINNYLVPAYTVRLFQKCLWRAALYRASGIKRTRWLQAQLLSHYGWSPSWSELVLIRKILEGEFDEGFSSSRFGKSLL